ncbi:hypothetical protein CR513_03159, partial [Mucuna pruriens]
MALTDIVELHHYNSLEDLVHQVAKVEMQLKRKQVFRKHHSTNRKGKERDMPKNNNMSPKRKDEKTPLPLPNSSKSSNIKCFKCLGKGHIVSQSLNKNTMILRENGEINNESSQKKSTSSSEVESSSDLFMVKKHETEIQRENIFHFRCLVLGKICSIIIYGRSSVNMGSLRLIEKLGISLFPRPKPYKL